ncbi:type II toxin-antitoxin system RatA family toxin [Lichenifustis flavocetrariae]|uniref:Type II toxin-antitoxin system RatA family toxin n=1 Tax=Lichenifustis flavocetrariae TaxID=2949735 RepID=A0AA41Z0Y5_9HYPH|nr:type II toxin-antitoxin system RatA family toxin [Lichenifustis flavocetrariae]MCW6510798.1 type II toxin-antitoxin system RatA family toxin [Lichenifustis flavocetrariae]
MPSFRTTRRVRHSAEHMFDLVADVESYPQFLPLCQSLIIRQRKLDEAGDGVILADMQVGYKAIRENFTSRVTLDRPGMTILVEYVEGPFRSLENRWTFRPEPGRPDDSGCTVEFFITYEFKSRVLSMLMGSMFDSAFRRFAEAFERRADQVYGRNGGGSLHTVRQAGIGDPL